MKKQLCIYILLIITMSVFLTSCGKIEIDTSEYDKEKIDISIEKDGKENKHSILIEDLKQLKQVNKTTNSTSDKIGKVKATGVYLDTLLEKYNEKQSNIKKIVFYSSDDYQITLDKDFINNNKIILSYGIDEKPLDKDSLPLRIIIPKSDSAYWIRMVVKIKCII